MRAVVIMFNMVFLLLQIVEKEVKVSQFLFHYDRVHHHHHLVTILMLILMFTLPHSPALSYDIT